MSSSPILTHCLKPWQLVHDRTPLESGSLQPHAQDVSHKRPEPKFSSSIIRPAEQESGIVMNSCANNIRKTAEVKTFILTGKVLSHN